MSSSFATYRFAYGGEFGNCTAPFGAKLERWAAGASDLQVAFVGQATYFEVCALDQSVAQIRPHFCDFRAGADPNRLLRELHALDPEVVIVFRPEIIPPGLFSQLEAVTLGWLTEPLPRPHENQHPDLLRRLKYLDAADRSNFDRIISFDPLIATTVADRFPIWRSVPLPVADAHFREVRAMSEKPRSVFIGRSTEHRELFLMPAKHEYDVLHVAHGVSGNDLRDLLGRYDVAINLHNQCYPSFENRVAIHLAAGNLVISEQLSPPHGLESGLDFLEVKYPQELMAYLFNIDRNPQMFQNVRIRGRAKAEYFRASKVYPRLIHDLLFDLRTFGTERGLE